VATGVTADADEAVADEPKDAPTLGLSDEVFPAGSDAAADEAEAAAPAEADEASETPGEPGSGS
jgi:hypothetical protein